MIKPISLFLLIALPLFLFGFSKPDHPSCQEKNTLSKIDRIEPPNWWAGMVDPKLQLLLHGEAIGHLRVEINYPGVIVQQITRTSNDNYLFLDLDIGAARAGTFTIQLKDQEKTILQKEYTLQERSSDPKDRKSFDQSDVLYLITPDRFANGDPKNDDLPGMKEKANRSFKGGRHGGDIEGIRQNLDYIHDLGFTAIWLNPVLENDMPKYSYHGYSTTDFYKVDPRFGSNESYLQLSQEARAKDIGLIMDMIVNHCGSHHWWMEDLPSEDWINQWAEPTYTNHLKTLSQDPHAAQSDQKVFFDGWFVATMPDLNQRNSLLATYLIQNSIWWVEYAHLAGIRMDTYPYPDMHFMSLWTEKVRAEFPYLNIVGEEWNEDPSIIAYWQQGKNNPNGYTSALPSLMDFPLQISMVEALTTEEAWGTGWITLYEALAKDFIYPNPEALVVFPDNHDMPRFFAQVGEQENLYRQGLVYTLTTRGVPQIYYGTEVLMTSPTERDDGVVRSDFPGGWTGDAVNAFEGTGLSTQQREAQAFLKQLLQWRKKSKVVHYGKLMHFAPQDGVYVYFRYDGAEKVMVILNKNEAAYDLDLDRFGEMIGEAKMAKEVLSGRSISLLGAVALPPMEALILEWGE